MLKYLSILVLTDRTALDGSNVIELAFLKNEPDRTEYTFRNGLITGVSFIPRWTYILDMEVTDSFIYWTSSGYGWSIIQRSNLDESNVITLVKQGPS